MTEPQIRRAMANCSRGDASAMTLPKDFAELDWAGRSFLGWRDVKLEQRGYLLRWRDGKPVGLLLRAADSVMSRRRAAMCLLCQSVRPSDEVTLFTARRKGDAGRRGDTVGTYMCADLACMPGDAVDARVDAFLAEVLHS
ncbi:FBP domain-containing protein [Catellatospora sichuanensis]|uniref:FBP domain-containing protein n=1 Tax=Catellatospora sichuanensis TaxID=1969805 RepID=UPI001181DD77|nr:FBP domain-containing protein [Catellatospora sichuanensis]